MTVPGSQKVYLNSTWLAAARSSEDIGSTLMHELAHRDVLAGGHGTKQDNASSKFEELTRTFDQPAGLYRESSLYAYNEGFGYGDIVHTEGWYTEWVFFPNLVHVDEIPRLTRLRQGIPTLGS
jgi:hypothetical protein